MRQRRQTKRQGLAHAGPAHTWAWKLDRPDIMFAAKLGRSTNAGTLDAKQKKRLHAAIVKTIAKAIKEGAGTTSSISTASEEDTSASWIKTRRVDLALRAEQKY